MIPNGKQYKGWIVLVVISLLLVGCAPSSEVTRENVSITQSDTKAKPSSKPYVDHHTNKNIPTEVEDQEAPIIVTPKANDKQEEVVVADETDSQIPSTDDKVYQVTEDFDLNNPTLMGFTINAIIDQVTERFGKPINQSIMNDGADPLQIYEYPGFIIGFDGLNHIEFIEVNSEDVNPGLNNLHIGQTVEDARNLLGAPDSLNEYVMIYSNNQTILKLDIDPNTSIIRSIKLFAE